MHKKQTFYLVSLGCAKNTVDSDSMAALMEEDGWQAVETPQQAEVMLVNTCGFIGPAREESYAMLRDLAAEKKRGQILIAAGCLTERYREQVVTEVPQIDGILGTRRWMDVVDVVRAARERGRKGTIYHLPENALTVGTDEKNVLRAAIQGSSAYLKIADGCRRPCAFCAIPLIKGTLVSRPMEDILGEAEILADEGVKELMLIAQDTTDYGHDLGMKDGLAELLDQLTQRVPEIPWIRILYTYPGYVTDRLIDLMASRPQILPYLDIPLQHAHPETLKRMKRPADMDWVRRTLNKMRQSIPGLALRTTLIVGYPGETEEEFKTLLDFVKETRFDHLGAFTFSFEPGTASETLGDTIPQEVKEARLHELMTLQEGISLARCQSLIGKRMEVLIEGQDKAISVGRSYRDAPEIDGLVIVEGVAEVGSMVPVMITGAMTHDLVGSLVSEGAG
ncbi:MAG TPA: 30S ribosomal protein S12 methylthiotransferase RimO [Anaerolineaceae bacterium]|nr:30S ribosomal protein S12 methylthiotransferase RimO [Anaerolineaceae bacterium]HPN50127.1 30S ribosomal protein S12 methylthiotransferase RimO [Anaerolineaceae bacterium]